MARGEEKRRRQRLHRERLREEREQNPGPELPMSPDQFVELFEHLDTWLPENGCDKTLRESMRWSEQHGIDPERVYEVFPEFGAGCDCEVILNMEEMFEEAQSASSS